ncbi:hypothetical protein C8Q80DRAFT_955238 [Daedaleopsis nitida]|nr:hypothetical protein C8Q80DRAFT_955238 [Daedaleopsis nitida]
MMMLALCKLTLAAALFGYNLAVPVDAGLEPLYATTWTQTMNGTPTTIVATIDSPFPTVITTTVLNGQPTTYTSTVWGPFSPPEATPAPTTNGPGDAGTTTCLTGWETESATVSSSAV